ncbi:MAG: sulfatase-like hydrolase/transferase [Bryobacter sp.]|nr:sulfatase-like hydrolase/transferase [Bryobacter sp.]
MTTSRRDFLLAPALLGQARRPPNVLVFMSDQESALLPGPASLPHREKLAQRAVRFDHMFCNTPQCSPARSSLITGLEPHRAGVLTNIDKSSLGHSLRPETPTAGHVFQKAGYATGYFGKWHLTLERSPTSAFGFDTAAIGEDAESARQAAEWLQKQKQQPWLAWVSVVNPHDIYELPRILRGVAPRPGVRPPATTAADLKLPMHRAFMEKDQGRPTQKYTPEDWIRYRSHYLHLLEMVDANLGAVLAAVPDWDNTIIVYTSDHGDALGEHGLPFKGPFMFDELLRVPLLIAAPGWKRGTRSDLVTSADLSPTLAALAGLRWPTPTDGKPLTRATDRDAVFLEYYSKQKWVNPIRTLRTRQWKLNLYQSGERELFDLTRDPHESANRAGQGEAIEAQLAARLNSWWAGPPMAAPAA